MTTLEILLLAWLALLTFAHWDLSSSVRGLHAVAQEQIKYNASFNKSLHALDKRLRALEHDAKLRGKYN